jgi:hypothetical protein
LAERALGLPDVHQGYRAADGGVSRLRQPRQKITPSK